LLFFFFFFIFSIIFDVVFDVQKGMDAGSTEKCLFPGTSVAGNAGSLSVNFQRLLAHGVGPSVIVTESTPRCDDSDQSLPVVATLDGHPGTVCCCRWSQRPLDNNLDTSYKLTLASGDDKGSVMIWSVLEGIADLHLTDTPVGAVLDMCWHPEKHFLLLTLRERNVVALWDTSVGSCLWRCVFKNLEDFAFVAFDAWPMSLPLRDVFFASRKGHIYWLADVESGGSTELVLKYKIEGPDPKSNFNGMQMYLTVPGCVLFVLSREVLVFDMTMQHAVGGFSLERGMASLVSISSSGNVVWALHEDGRISLWRAQGPSFSAFSLVGSSAQLRFAKTRRQDAVPLVCLQARGGNGGEPLSCLAIDRLGALFSWSLDGGSLHVEEMRQGLSSAVSSFALHPVVGARRVACGTVQGTLVVVDLVARRVLREFLIDNGQVVRGVQWFGNDHVMLFVVQDVQADLVWINSVLKVHVPSGGVKPLLQHKRAEPTHIRLVKLSPSGRYLLVFRKDRPVELLDVTGEVAVHLGNIKPYIQVNAMAWRVPNVEEVDGGSDEFAAATTDNMIRTFRVESGRLVVVRQQEVLTVYPIACISWRGDVLVTGDTSGGLCMFDWKRKVCWTVNLRGASIADLQFNRTSSTLLVLFVSGGVCVYDVSVKRQVNESTLLSVRSIRVSDLCWWHECPVLLCSEGCFRVTDAMLMTSNVPLALSPASCVATPYLLEARAALALKVSLLHAGSVSEPDALLRVPRKVLALVSSSASYAEKALIVARYFGDVWEENLWQMVLKMSKAEPSVPAQSVAIAAASFENTIPLEKILFLRQSSASSPSSPSSSSSSTEQRLQQQTTLTGTLPSSFGLIRREEEVREQ
jgi:WD40 repeat protein